MIIEGTHQIEGVSAEAVFDALADPAVLARTVPGCRSLTDRGDGNYDVAIDVGVGSVRGAYSGRVTIREHQRPELYEATLEASGPPGSVTAALRAEFSDSEGGTSIGYQMDAKIAGRIAGVGQRVIAGVSRKNATAFFNAVERELTAATEESPASSGPVPENGGQAVEEPVAGLAPSSTDAPRVYPGTPRIPSRLDRFVVGMAGGLFLSLLISRHGRRPKA